MIVAHEARKALAERFWLSPLRLCVYLRNGLSTLQQWPIVLPPLLADFQERDTDRPDGLPASGGPRSHGDIAKRADQGQLVRSHLPVSVDDAFHPIDGARAHSGGLEVQCCPEKAPPSGVSGFPFILKLKPKPFEKEPNLGNGPDDHEPASLITLTAGPDVTPLDWHRDQELPALLEALAKLERDVEELSVRDVHDNAERRTPSYSCRISEGRPPGRKPSESLPRWNFILTGSSARQLRRGSANLLPGRSIAHTLTPVMQAECRPSTLLPAALPAEPRFPQRSLEDYLLFGSLPGLYSEGRDAWAETLATWADLYIENEVRQENIVRDMGAFSRFIELAALESGRIVNYTKMASAVGVAVNTLRNFFQVLEDTFLGIRVPPFTETRRRVALAPRFVLFDIGVRHALAGLRISEDLIRIGAEELFEHSGCRKNQCARGPGGAS